MERNYNVVKFGDAWAVEYEFYSLVFQKWFKKFYKDYNGDVLKFEANAHAKQWVEARQEIIDIN